MTVHSFTAELGNQPMVLILGSMPGKRSLGCNQYYAHPRNSFWPAMAEIVSVQLSAPYKDRLKALLSAGVGLWDVVESCEREGSLDSKIIQASVAVNPILELLKAYQSIKAIGFNGQASYKLFQKHLGTRFDELDSGVALLQLPSTSPAYSAMRPAEKIKIWAEQLAPFIDVEQQAVR